jgi:hypothetical protein
MRAAGHEEGGAGLSLAAQYGWQGPTLSAGFVIGRLDQCHSRRRRNRRWNYVRDAMPRRELVEHRLPVQ